MARLNVAVRLCCIFGAHALSATATGVRYSPASGVGFRVEVSGCDATAGGCKANSTAIFKVNDDSGNEVVSTFCTAFDSFNEEKLQSTAAVQKATFFYAFTMPAGNKGSYWMSTGCFMDMDGDVADPSAGGLQPTSAGWTAVTYANPGTQFTNQPGTADSAMPGNATDVYIPLLMFARPYSPDKALSTGSYREAQFAYTSGSASEEVAFYFNEAVTGVEDKMVTLHEYKPTDTWVGTGTGSNQIPKAASTFTTSMLSTKVSTSFAVTKNRLYKVLVDGGAFADLNGNAAAGVNGQGTKYSTCVELTTNPIGRDCLIAFAVPMTVTDGTLVRQFPLKVAGSPVDLETTLTITKETNVVLEFNDAVTPGSYSSSLKMTFGSDLTGADLVVGGSGTNCFTGGNCHSLFSSTYYIFEPADALKDATTTWNATEISVSFPAGAFDYVNAYSYTFLTNSTTYDGRTPEILAYQFGTQATYMGDEPYYEDESDFLSWGGADNLVLYFDTKVSGASDKFVTFTPTTYADAVAKTITSATCFTAPTDLVPCKFTADTAALVAFAASTGTKVTIDPGQLIPGQTYNASLQAGAFVAAGTSNGVTAAWHTMFYVPQTVKACQVSAADGVSVPLHRSGSIMITFDGPVFVDNEAGAIEVGEVKQHMSNPDVVYHRNNKDAASNHFMIIVEPRVSETEAGMPADTTVSVDVVSGVLRNFAAQSLCSTYTTLYEDVVAPELLSVAGLTGATTNEPYGFSQYGATTVFTLHFSEKVVAATGGVATLHRSTNTKTFGLGGSGQSADTTFTISDRTVTLSVTDGILDTGDWTLSVPYTALTDLATETGTAANPFVVPESNTDMTAGVTAATATFTVASAGATAPTCTVTSSAVVAGTSLNWDEVRAGTISRTLVLEFSEGVTVRDTTKTIDLYAVNRTTNVAQKVLTMGLDGELTCLTWSGNSMGCGTTTGTLEHDWMDGCVAGAGGCVDTDAATLPGGGHYLFVFLHNLEVMEDFKSYYFTVADPISIVTLYDYPVVWSNQVGPFTVYNPNTVVRTGVQIDSGDTTRGSTDNILLTFNEKVDFVGDGVIATIAFKTTREAVASFSYQVKKGNTTHGVVLSADGMEAVVHVPYYGRTTTSAATQPSAFDYLTITFADESFVDLSLTGGTSAFQRTNSSVVNYNSTVANFAADPNTTWSSASRTDGEVPRTLMMLPSGAVGNKQVVTGINTTAKIYLLMSENVSLPGTGGVTLYECGQYVITGGVSGYSHAPLTSPSCSGLSGSVSTELSLLDNAFGSSVVEVSVPAGTQLKVSSKYLLQVAASTFKDMDGGLNAVTGVGTGDKRFEFYTEGDRAKPVHTRYVYDQSVSTLAAGTTVLTVWFSTVIGNFTAQIANGLVDAGETTNDVTTEMICSGGFKCTVSTTAALAQDTTYLVKIPSSIYDREHNYYAGAAAAVSFKTTATNTVAPRVAFCSDVTVGSNSVSLKLGFTEAVVLYGGYTSTTPATTATSAYLQNNVDFADLKSVQLGLEAGGTVVSISSAETLTAGAQYNLYVPAAEFQDAAGLPLGTDITINATAGITSTLTCSLSALGSPDVAKPTAPAVLPAGSATTVHDGDYVVFKFNEEVQGSPTGSLVLTKCGVQSQSGSCVEGAVAETVSAVDLKFGGQQGATGNAMWQMATALEPGVVYAVSAPSGTFEDLSSNSYDSAAGPTFQVALESWDYRGDSMPALAKASDYHSNTVVSFGSGSRLGLDDVDAAASQTLSLYFAQKVQQASGFKIYLNATAGTHYVEKTAALSGGNAVSLTLAANDLKPGTTYSLEVYVNDKDWSTGIFDDADEYYTYFGNYKATTAYRSEYSRPESSRFKFNTGAAPTAVWYSAPTLASQPFKVGWGTYSLNASANVSTSAMLEVTVNTNSSISIGSNPFTVSYAARISASTDTDTDCTNSFGTCCSTSWTTDTSAQSTYIDFGGSEAKVYFSLDGGLQKYSCYRVSIPANAFVTENGDSTDKGPASTSPDYTTWFTTDDVAHQTDYAAPTVQGFDVSSQGVDSSFRLVARSAYLTVDFNEAVTGVNLDLVALSPTPGTVASVSGSQMTVTPNSDMDAGTTFTLTISPGAVKDGAGNYFSSSYTQTFMTVYNDGDTPMVLHSIPESTDTASTDARMVLFMSERVSAVSGSATIGTATVAMTQSTFDGFQDPTSKTGAVVVEGTRVTFASYGSLPTTGTAAKLTVPGSSLEDDAGRSAATASVSFTAEAFSTFDEPTLAASPTYGGDTKVALEGATAVSCGTTLYLVGGGDLVHTWDGSAWSKVESTGLGDRKYASVAADMDCKLWVVGGSGTKTDLAMSRDGGKEFKSVDAKTLVVTPLPVDEVQEDGESVLVKLGVDMEGALQGSSLAVVNGWQVVVCGGGLSKCWVCKDAECAIAGKSAAVPAEVSGRYYGTMLVVDGDYVYYFGGYDKAASETQCHQSVWMWDVQADEWEGMAAQMDMSAGAASRCGSAYAQAGDGMIVVVGGDNATDTTKDEYAVGPLSNVLEAERPLLDSTAYLSDSTFAEFYARPVLFAYGPTRTGLTSSTTSEPVHLAFSEPVKAGAGCVEVHDGITQLYCSAADGKCYTTACGGSTGVPVASTTVSIARSIVTIDVGSLASGSRVAAWTVSVTLPDDVVQDLHGNGFLASKGSSSRGQVGSFSFGFAARAAAFAGTFVQPAASTAVDLDTNIVFTFNREVDESSILPAFDLKVTPVVPGATIKFDENSTESFTFAGDIFKVALSGSVLIPGMTYTATLAGNSVQSAGGATLGGALSQTFTARNGAARGAEAGSEAGVAYVVENLVDDDADHNDTAGIPTVVSIAPPQGMTGVRKDAVHVVYTFSEPVTLFDTRNQSNYVIEKAFTLQFLNSSSNAFEATQDLKVGTDVFVNTTAKQVTVALAGLDANTKYKILVTQGVITDFVGDAAAMESASTDVWNSIKTSLNDFVFTTVGSVVDASKPKVVASFATPVTSSGAIILDDDEQTQVSVVFDKPLDSNAVDGSLKLHTDGEGFSTGGVSGEVLAGEVLLVNVSDFVSTVTSWNLYLPNAETGKNFVNMTAELPSRVTLMGSLPVDTGSTYDKFADDATIVLTFSEDIQQGSGVVTVAATHDATANSRSVSVDDAEVTLIGKYLVIEHSDLMAGEKYQVSMENGTVKGVSTSTGQGRQGIQEAAYTPSSNAFATVLKIRFKTSTTVGSFQASGAGVGFGPDNKLYAIGGKRSGAVSNYTSVSTTRRDTDAGVGGGVPSRCTDPCAGLPQTVTETVYGSPSTRGLRGSNAAGVAQSIVGAELYDTAGVACKCPRCIDAPVTIPANGHFFHDDNTVYTQVSADSTTVALTCDVGGVVMVDDDKYRGDLKATQGYDATEPFTCTVGDTTGATDPLAEYFGIWSISEDACAPKLCDTAPTFPGQMFAGSDAECMEYNSGSGNTSTFSMPHGDNCTVSCNAGYERTGVFECDRGIYTSDAGCKARTCTHSTVPNGQLQPGSSADFEGKITVNCDAGYQAVGADSVTCNANDNAVAESEVSLSGALSCEKKSCAAKPSDGNAASVSCDADLKFGATCTITCNDGFYYGTEGEQSGTAECSEDDGSASVAWSGVSQCIAVVCAVPMAMPESWNVNQLSEATSLDYDATMTVSCAPGYAVAPENADGTSVTVTCGAASAKADLSTSTECKERNCGTLSAVGLSATGTCTTDAMEAGDTCKLQCTGTDVPLADLFTHVKCVAGGMKLCTTDSCSGDLSPVGSTACKGAKQTVTEVTAVASTATIQLAAEARRLSTSAQGQLEAQIDAVLSAFSKAMATTLEVAANKVVVTGHSLSPAGEGNVNLVIDFYVEVEAGSALTSIQGKLQDFAAGDASMAAALKSAFSDELEAAGLTVAVGDVTVSAPEAITVYVPDATDAPGDGDDAEGGGGGAIIAVVVVVVLIVIGGVVWKFVLKK